MRVRLPIWRRGCGIRSRLSLAPAAFCSTFRTSCERLLARHSYGGRRHRRLLRPARVSFRRPPSSRRGEALWEREAAGSGSLGAASSESAAGSVRLRGCG